MNFDLVIVGGGLVGAGLAAALRESSLRIALVDARLPSSNDPRLFALNHGSCQFLSHVNVWPQLVPHASPIHQVHVSRRGRFGAVRLNKEDVSLPYLGYVIPAKHIEAALNEMLLSLPNVTLYRPATLLSLTQENGIATLLLQAGEDQHEITSSLVIGADGTVSTVREQSNIESDVVDYQQSAIVTRTRLHRSHDRIAYERFTANGAIAMLPLPDNECATIWTANTAEVTDLMSLSDVDFLAQLQKEFGYRLGRLAAISQRHVFPLKMVRAKKMKEGCVWLLGNSAHTVHPIAAQGFNLALYEVAVIVEALLKQEELKDVEKKISRQQELSIGVSHRLSQLFSSQSELINLLTQIGMTSLDAVLPLKKRFVNGVLGRSGTAPRLLLDANGS